MEVAYRAKARTRARRMVLNPLGIVVRVGIVYLVATSWDYEDVRHYVLHRMSKPQLLDEPARAVPGFRLLRYIGEENRFSYPVGSGRISLRVLFEKEAAMHLMESQLAEDHRTTEQEDGRVLVEPTAPGYGRTSVVVARVRQFGGGAGTSFVARGISTRGAAVGRDLRLIGTTSNQS